MIFASKSDLNKMLIVLLFRSPEFRWGHPKYCLETAVERNRVGKAAGLANLLNGKPLVTSGLGEGGTDALLRQPCAVDERLTLEVGIFFQI